jgi:fatty acid synthase subunit alpha
MQRAVERDSENRSSYAICAMSPSHISPSFSDEVLCEVAVAIALWPLLFSKWPITVLRQTDRILRRVLRAGADQQYVCAGELIPFKP